MIIQNRAMNLLPGNDSYNYDVNVIDHKINSILGRIMTIKDCLVISVPTVDITDEKKFGKYFNDETGFEAAQNEIDLNSEFERGRLTKEFALTFFERFNNYLKNKFFDKKFCSVMSQDNRRHWIFRFHVFRAAQGLWLTDDIETYREPVLYEIF